MGQIIRLPVPPAAFPDSCARLDTAECVALLAMRWWVAVCRLNEDPMPRIAQGLARAGAGKAAYSIDTLMAVIARSARRRLSIHRPRCPAVSSDEQHLLHAASLVQHGDSALAEKVLRTALISAQGAEFALGPLHGVATLFAQARLHFRRRPAPTACDPAQPWPPGLFQDMAH
ncbi:MAG: hypothetical protein U1E70_03250 [Acetobacteraceae bacterium]